MKAISEGAVESSRGPARSARGGETAEARFRALAIGELDRAYRLAGLLLGDANEAEDATQEALLRAWSALSSLRDPAGFQGWFDRIATDGSDVYHTTNGGAGWTHVTTQTPISGLQLGLQDAQFVDLNHGWAQWTDSQGNSHILATSDGGATWHALAP